MGFFLYSLLLLNGCYAIVAAVKELIEGNVYWHTYLLLAVAILMTCIMTALLGSEFVLYKLKQAKVVDEFWEKEIEKGDKDEN